MGNCVFKGPCEMNNHNNNNNNKTFASQTETNTIKVTTVNGGVMELFPPITAECITSEFPNHAIFTTQHPLGLEDSLLHTDQLRLGHSYFLLPINKPQRQLHCSTPYRMSLDTHSRHHQKRWSSSDGLGLELSSTPRSLRSNNNGVWKVKLVISSEQLAEILAQEATTEELVESLRTVAKCGNGSIAASGSDKWTVSSTIS